MLTIATALTRLPAIDRIPAAIAICRADPTAIGAAYPSLELRVASARLGHVDPEREHEWEAAACELELAYQRWLAAMGDATLPPTMQATLANLATVLAEGTR
jgi:hypothetical protein